MPSEGPSAPLLDPAAIETLRKVAGNQGDGFVAEMAQLFLEETTKSLRDLREGCDRGDWKVVARVAHSVKSSSATLGLMRLSEACRDLEFHTQGAGSTPGTVALAASVIEQFEHAVPTLKGLS